MKQTNLGNNINLQSLNRFFLSVLLISISLCAYSQGTTKALGGMKPIKSLSPIKIDGILDEPIWQNALFSDKMYGKKDNAIYFTNTRSYFTYDADNLYSAFKCKVNDTSLLSKIKYEKDDQRILENEWVAFCVDTYNDGIAAYTFIVDASGNQLDGSLNPTKDLTFSFSSNWTSAVKKEVDGYTVEMKIPRAQLPVQWNKDSVGMSILMIRYDKLNSKGLIQNPYLISNTNSVLTQFQKVILEGIHQTYPINLSGVDISARLAYKKSRIDISTLDGRSRGGDASVMDYMIFKKREVAGAEQPRMFHYSIQSKWVAQAFENTAYMKSNYPKSHDFETFLERAQTTAIIVLQNDTIVYEKYFNGFNRNSIFASFSVGKSFVSTLIGLAIANGYIKSDTDRITTYIPELLKKDPHFSDITIRDLLSMSSGLEYSEEGYPSDDVYSYQDPDLRKSVLEHVRIAEAPGKRWLYNNYNPLLLGLILERTTHMSVSKYLEEKLWKKMGGGNASWSLDEHGFEKMEGGINCGAYDYARFAVLLLDKGRYNNEQVVPEDWILKATQPQRSPLDFYNDLSNHNTFYSYFWWGKFRGNKETTNDFFGLGNKGEYMYVCPQKKIVIIRLGFEYGLATPAAFSWPDLFYQFATNFKAQQ